MALGSSPSSIMRRWTAIASRGWLHMLQAMMRVLKVRSTGSTPCSRYHKVGSDQA